MDVFWSPHARSLLDEIVVGMAEALSVDDALRWEADFRNAAERMGDFPFLGAVVPVECFAVIPKDVDQLRQVFCGPYRIVYEPVGDEIHILAIRHSRMLVSTADTFWN